ncbi:MAG TPA: hypothetical protein VF118_05580 [Gemmatimonadaceae bacterium]
MASHHSHDLTVAFGPTGTAGWIAGFNASGGVYGSTTPEFGIFGSAGVVLGLFGGISGGGEWTFIFGTPSDFAGPFLCFQASVGPKIFGGMSIGGSLLFSIKSSYWGPTALTFMGFTANVTWGWSPLPGSITVEWSNTWVHPLIK